MGLSLARKVNLGFGVALAIVLAIGIAAAWNTRRLVETADWVVRTHAVLEALNGLSAALAEATASHRGYVLSGDERYLSLYRAAVPAVRSRLQDLRALTADNPARQRQLGSLEPLVARRLFLLDEALAVPRADPGSVADRQALMDRGKVVMDDIRRVALAIRSQEEALRERRVAEARASARWSLVVIFVGGAVAVAVVGLALVVISREIGERLRAEDAVRQSQHLYRAVLSRFPNGAVLLFDRELRYRLAEGLGLAAAGLSKDALEGKTIRELFPEEFCRVLEPAYRSALAGESSVLEVPYAGRDHEVRVSPAPGPDGAIEAGIVVTQDITERKRAEQALRQSEERLRLATTGAGIGIWHSDLAAGELLSSGTFKALFGMPGDEPMGYERFWRAVHPDDRERVERVVEEALADKKDYENEFRAVWPDGSVHWIAARGRGSYGPEGRPVLLQGVAQDVTERKRAEEEVHRLNRELARHVDELTDLNREMEAFSYSVSHDLRAPLRHVQGFVDLLRRHVGDSLDAAGRRYLDTITGAALRMGELIDDLLTFSRMGRVELLRSRVELSRLVEEVVREMAEESAGRDVVWKTDGLRSVSADPATLRVVLTNLLGNALKYTRPRERAEIEIGVRANGDEEVVVFVRDNGVGFDMRYADKLFGVFQRLHRAEEFEGTGIGLATVRRIIHRHGGRTWAEGAVDGGATFFFSLPIPPKEAT